MSDPKQTRGYRDNNPFDLMDNGIAWKGICGTDGRMLKFSTAALGLRAGYKDLRNAQKLHGRHTVRAIVTPYAPPEENDTEAYVAAVAEELGVGPDDELNMEERPTLRRFGDAVIRREIGGVPYDEATLAEAVRQALE